MSDPTEDKRKADRRHGERRSAGSRKKLLIIVNPYATTVSDRLKNLVVYALQARFEVEAIDTEAKDHATEIGREAIEGGYDLVVAFGGDGTLNEVANGLAGTDVPVSVLPGGSTNVVCRSFGIPNDVVDATEHLLSLADDLNPTPIDLGLVGDRRFVFACGAGLDATVVERVDSNPRLKTRYGYWYYTYAAVSGFTRNYLRNPVRMSFETGEETSEGVTTIIQNSDPFTYFAKLPVRVCEDVEFSDGHLSAAVLNRAGLIDVPNLATRMLVERLRAVRARHVTHFTDIKAGRMRSISEDADGNPRPFPVQVDGDFIGNYTDLEIGIEPAALNFVA